jgi:hypothetical protein
MPVRPREPMMIVARVVALGDLENRLPDGSACVGGDRLGVQARLASDADPLSDHAAEGLPACPVDMSDAVHACRHRNDQRLPTAEQMSRTLDCVSGVARAVVTEQQWAVGGRRVAPKIDRVGRQR